MTLHQRFRRLALLGLCLWLFPAVNAQFAALGKHEKRWVVFHPFAAMKVRRINDQCRPIYDQPELRSFLDSFPSGGKLDAYRHAFFMAAFAQRVKPRRLKKLGEAHEKTNYRQFLEKKLEEGEKPDSLASVMDLHNNELGISTGRANRHADLTVLSGLVIKKINAGEALIFKRDKNGRYLDCAGNPVDTKNYRDRWFVPKCLVRSSDSGL